MDIKSGDLLKIGSQKYPIKKCNEHTMEGGNSLSFQSMASVSCEIYRSPDETADMIVGSAVEHLTGLSCLPLSPVGANMAIDAGLADAQNIFLTYISDGDGFVELFIQDSLRT